MKKAGTAVALSLALLLGCQVVSPELEASEVEAIRNEVVAALRRLEQADRDRDADTVVAMLARGFYMYADGQRVDHATAARQITATLPTLRSFEAAFSAIEVMVIGRDAAVSSMTFRDVITDASGQVSRKRGPTTIVWHRHAGEWQIAYLDADHYDDRTP